MSSNTNNLRDILEEFLMNSADASYANNGNGDKVAIAVAYDEAIAAVLALLPEKLELVKSHPEAHRRAVVGYNEAIDQTRRNLIGEQR